MFEVNDPPPTFGFDDAVDADEEIVVGNGIDEVVVEDDEGLMKVVGGTMLDGWVGIGEEKEGRRMSGRRWEL